jgi:hypothetical protein
MSTGTQEVFSPVTDLEDLDRMAHDPDMSFESLSLSERLNAPWRQPPTKRAKPIARSSLARSQGASKPHDENDADIVLDNQLPAMSSTPRAGTRSTSSVDNGSSWIPRWKLDPGEYDIVLVVDTMEQTGSRKDKGVIQVQCTHGTLHA